MQRINELSGSNLERYQSKDNIFKRKKQGSAVTEPADYNVQS